MPSGLKLQDIHLGDGEGTAVRGDTVFIHFRCFLNRGDLVRSTYEVGPESFCLGDRDIIAGLWMGLEGMKVGGLRKIRISPHLAYGDKERLDIPPNAVLKFEVELLALRKG